MASAARPPHWPGLGERRWRRPAAHVRPQRPATTALAAVPTLPGGRF